MLAALTALATLTALTALLLTVRVALLALATLLALAGLLVLLLLALARFALALLSLILLITHGNLLLLGLTRRKRGALLLRSCSEYGIVAVLVAVSATFAADADDRAACYSETLGSFDSGVALDARSFKLPDGREIVLAGIEVPSTFARTALARLLADGKITLRQGAPAAADRYGRIVAQVFVQRGDSERWVQQELLAAGHAQVGTRPGNTACAKILLASEAPARRDRRGLWADSASGIKASDDLAGLLASRDQFTVAEGKVWSVRESGSVLYLNFGRIWSLNLTVTILRRNRAGFESAGMDPKKLEGALIRVRGFVEERGGPRIEAARPEQIEIVAQR